MHHIDRNIVRDIKEYGWHVVRVIGEEASPAFAYSVGLYQRFGHPEALIFGLDLDVMHEIINVVGDTVSEGISFISGQSTDTVLHDLSVVFRSVDRSYFDSYLGRALVFYSNDSFPVQQVFWPDPSGKFPWQDGYASELKSLQPLLFA